MVEVRRDWARLLLSTLEESPLVLHDTFRKRNLRCNSWQCHILACMFSCLAPRIRSEIVDWSFLESCRRYHVQGTDPKGDPKTSTMADAMMMEVAFKEAFHAIKQAENFYYMCCSQALHEDWGIVRALISTACTGEALTVHIHNLFWCISSLLLATRVALGFSEEKLNALVEQQVYCWSTHIARYIRLGAELLDLRHLVGIAEETNKKLRQDGASKGEEQEDYNEEEGRQQAPPSHMMKHLMCRLKRALLKSPGAVIGQDRTCSGQDQVVLGGIDALLHDLRIPAQDLTLNQVEDQEDQGYTPASWSGLRVVVKKCTKHALRERAPTLLRMRNPFILQFIGWSEIFPATLDDNTTASCYMVMEAVEMDLKCLIKDMYAFNNKFENIEQAEEPGKVGTPAPPFEFRVALDMMLQVARGMWYLHRNGVAHGTLQSSKILVETSKVLELSGEGYSRLKICAIGFINDQGQEDSQVNLSFQDDVLSFGKLCVEILTGQIPNDPHRQNDLQQKLKPPVNIPLLLGDCLIACCDMQPQNRPEFGAICGLLRHIKLIVTNPNRLERLLNFLPAEDNNSNKKNGSATISPHSIQLVTKSSRAPTVPPTDADVLLDLINVNVNVLYVSSPAEVYPLISAAFVSAHDANDQVNKQGLLDRGTILSAPISRHPINGVPLGFKALEKMSTELMEKFRQKDTLETNQGLKFIIANGSTLKASLVEGGSGLLSSSWTSTALGMGTLEMWMPFLPTDWKILHHIALGIALCLRHVSKTPPKMGFYSEQGIDGFYPFHTDNILLNCQFKVALLLDNSSSSWQRLFQWAGTHPQVGNGDNMLLSIEAYTTYYFGQLLSCILKPHQAAADASESLQNKRFEFVLANLASRCIQLKYLSMTEVVTILLNEYRSALRA